MSSDDVRPFITRNEAHAFASALKRKAETMEPGLDAALDFARYGIEMRRRMVQNLLFSRFGNTVQSGPFAGMELPPASFGSLSGPRLLGCYEQELHEFVEDAGRYRRIVNVGCAEGWYAIGLARRFPHLEIIAYDISEASRSLCAATAERNGVRDRLDIRAECTAADLDALAEEGTLVVMDIEGGERDLLAAVSLDAAARCDWLIETHVPGEVPTLGPIVERFSASHDVTVIEQQARSPDDHPLLRQLGQLDRFLAQWEGRGPEPWVFLKARAA